MTNEHSYLVGVAISGVLVATVPALLVLNDKNINTSLGPSVKGTHTLNLVQNVPKAISNLLWKLTSLLKDLRNHIRR